MVIEGTVLLKRVFATADSRQVSHPRGCSHLAPVTLKNTRCLDGKRKLWVLSELQEGRVVCCTGSTRALGDRGSTGQASKGLSSQRRSPSQRKRSEKAVTKPASRTWGAGTAGLPHQAPQVSSCTVPDHFSAKHAQRRCCAACEQDGGCTGQSGLQAGMNLGGLLLCVLISQLWRPLSEPHRTLQLLCCSGHS